MVSETPARLGGDEFAIIIEEPISTDAIISFAQRVTEALERPVTFAHGELFLHCSLGIAVADDQNRANGTELLRQADIAMYTAKSNGKARIDVFESSIAVDLVERIALAQDMQRAVLRDELVLHYQPIVSLATSEIIGFEALVRWDHPRLGLLPPDRFIAVAEENGTIRELGAWVLNRATEQLVVWREATRRDLFMAVNVSARQLAMSSFVDDVEAALESRPIPAHTLVLEITESAVMADAAQSLTRLRDLKELGVQLAVDDFGTGYSSLNYLRRFPVDVLKIDKAFVDEIADQFSKDTALVHTIIEIGRTLGLEVVAEGIEHEVQVEALRDLGCETGQGYHFGRPLPSAEIGKLLCQQAIEAA